MASAHIEIDRSERHAAKLGGMVDSLISIRAQVLATKAQYDQFVIGDDYAALGVALGLTGENASTDAQAIYNLLGSVQTELEASTFTHQLTARLG